MTEEMPYRRGFPSCAGLNRKPSSEGPLASFAQHALDAERDDLVLRNQERRNPTRAASGPTASVDTRPYPAVARAIITRIHKRDTSLPGSPTQ